jgi:hypothetical protein
VLLCMRTPLWRIGAPDPIRLWDNMVSVDDGEVPRIFCRISMLPALEALVVDRGKVEMHASDSKRDNSSIVVLEPIQSSVSRKPR